MMTRYIYFAFIWFILLYSPKVFTFWTTLVHFGLLSCGVQEFSCLPVTRHALIVCFMLANWLLPMPRQQTVLSWWLTVTLFGLCSNMQEHKSRDADKCCSLLVCVLNLRWILCRWRCNWLIRDVLYLLTLLCSCSLSNFIRACKISLFSILLASVENLRKRIAFIALLFMLCNCRYVRENCNLRCCNVNDI
jgi:hypothetical protein